MYDAPDMVAAQEQALGIFADAVLKLALHIQQEALDTEDLDQKVKLAGAFHRLGRGLRQTVALQAKLARDARVEAAKPRPEQPSLDEDFEPEPDDPVSIAVKRRGDWLTRGVERCVWNEYESGEGNDERIGESLLGDFDERLADLMADPDAFLDRDPNDLLVELCKELGVTPPSFSPPAPMVTPASAVIAAANGHDSS